MRFLSKLKNIAAKGIATAATIAMPYITSGQSLDSRIDLVQRTQQVQFGG